MNAAWSPAEPPGAVQLELLRRLDTVGSPGPELVARILRRAAPGRGMVELTPTDPPRPIPDRELLRVGSGVLADLVMELGPLPERDPAFRPWQLRNRPSFVLEGPPLTVARLRAGLGAVGMFDRGSPKVRRVLRPRRPDLVVLVTAPLPRALFEVWAHRAQQGSLRRWPTVVAAWRGSGRLPAGAAYDRRAAFWADVVGSRHVHVVTRRGLGEQVQAVLGSRPRDGVPPPTGAPADLSPVLVDVLRCTNEVLTFKAAGPDRRVLVDRLVAVLADLSPRGPTGLDVPVRHREWLADTGEGISERLLAGGYPVHGRLSHLGRSARRRSGTLPAGAVLTSLLEVVLRVDGLLGDRSREKGQR